MAIKVSGTTVIDDNRNISGSTLTATRLGIPPVPITFSPAIGATARNKSNIIITFDQQVFKGTGNITLRSGSAGGTVLQTIGVSSSVVTISGGAVTIDPPANIGIGVTIFVVVDAGAFSGITTTSVNDIINTYSFTTESISLGSSFEGGYVICKASGLAWIVSPYSAEVRRTWYNRDDSNTRAQQVTGSPGWFVPTCGQLQNPGSLCRSFWGPSPCNSASPIGGLYWTSTEGGADYAYAVFLQYGDPIGYDKSFSYWVRSFRCVTY
jgi:hypothetical protein